MRNDDDVQTSWIDATENPFLAIEESVSRTRRAERIAKMSAETQRAILAVYRSGSFKAAAAELGTSIANVKELLEKVNDQLSAVEGGHPTAQAAPRQREIIDDFLSEKDLETYLPQLTEQQRTVYTAVVINGKSYGEAAEIFRVAEGTIKSSLSRARSRLAEFKGIEIDMSTHTERLRSWFRDNPKTFREAVKGLPSYLQRVANLLIVESKSPTEIASLLKLPINTVKSQRHSLYQSLSNR